MKHVSNSILILLSILSLGCGQVSSLSNQTGPQSNTSPASDQQARLMTFIQEGSNRGVSLDTSQLTIVYSTLVDSSHWAICNFDASGNPMISLALDVPKQSATFQEELLFHELGHCLLWRQHNGAFSIPLGGPSSLMNASLVNETQYSNNRSAYLDELFSSHGSSKPASGS